MKDEKYNGLGNDEYNIYKTLDNGKTWKNIHKSPGQVQKSRSGRIIIYSNSNKGLKYSDDEMITINDSNVSEGNFKNIPVPHEPGGDAPIIDRVFALSLDGNGIYETLDNGETWKFVSCGTGDTIDIIDGKPAIYGNGDLVIIPTEKNELPQFYPNSTFSPDGPIAAAEEIGPNQEVKTGEGLIYILNEILVPKLSSILTGHEDIKYFKFNNSPEMGNKYFTDYEVYKVDRNGIDWAGDVGMMPLVAEDIKDYEEASAEAKKITEKYIQNEEELNKELEDSNTTIYKIFKVIDKTLEAKKTLLEETKIKSIINKEEDYEGIKTAEGKSAMKMLYTVQRGAEASIIGTIINSIFTFDNSKKMSLLRASIIITADRFRGKIQSILSAMYLNVKNGLITKEDMKNSNEYQNLLTFKNLYKDWLNGLNSAIDIYCNECEKNIRTVSSNMDRKYINIAADKYKEIREDLLDEAVSCVRKIQIEIPSEGKNRLYQLGDDLDFAINQVTAAAVKYQALPEESRDKDALEKELDEIYNVYLEKETKLRKLDDPFSLKRTEELISEAITKSINKEINKENKNLKDKFYFDDIDYQENLSKLEPFERDKVIKYYKSIIDKFKKRCVDLMKLITADQSKWLFDLNVKMSDDLKFYIHKLKYVIDATPYDLYRFDNTIDHLSEEIKGTYEEYIQLSKNNWVKMREKI